LLLIFIADMLDEAEFGEFPDDNRLACYFKCIMEKGGVVRWIFFRKTHIRINVN